MPEHRNTLAVRMARRRLSLVVWALLALHAVCAFAEKAQNAKLVSSVSVEGLVFCDRCLQEKKADRNRVLKGAKVSVVCESKATAGAREVKVVAITDANGQFKAVLPKEAFDGEGRISCAVELKESPAKSCKLPGNSKSASKDFRLQKMGGDALVYAAGELTYHPYAPTLFCSQDSYYKAPSYTPPTYTPPVYTPPTYTPPTYTPPVYKTPPTYTPPTYQPPVYKTPPTYTPPTYQPPVYKAPPTYTPPTYQPPVYKAPPTYTPPTYQPPVYKAPPTYTPPVYKAPPTYSPPVYKAPPTYTPPTYQPPTYTPPTYKPPTYTPPSFTPPTSTPPPTRKWPRFKFPKVTIPKFRIPKLDFPKRKWPYHPPENP